MCSLHKVRSITAFMWSVSLCHILIL